MEFWQRVRERLKGRKNGKKDGRRKVWRREKYGKWREYILVMMDRMVEREKVWKPKEGEMEGMTRENLMRNGIERLCYRGS